MKEKAIIENRPFQALLMDADIHLREARIAWEEMERALSENSREIVPHDGPRAMRAASRACIVVSVAGVEAFAIWTYNRFRKREPVDLQDNWITSGCRYRSGQIKEFENWDLKDKLWLLPSLCLESPMGPAFVFERKGRKYNEFIEFVKIRNAIAHGHETTSVYEIDSDTKTIDDQAEKSNFWPLTKVAKDLFSIGHSDAQKAYDCCIWALQILVYATNGRILRSQLVNQSLRIEGHSADYDVARESIADDLPDWIGRVLAVKGAVKSDD